MAKWKTTLKDRVTGEVVETTCESAAVTFETFKNETDDIYWEVVDAKVKIEPLFQEKHWQKARTANYLAVKHGYVQK